MQYRERAAQAEQKIREMQAVAQPVDRLLASVVLTAAALNVLMKHDLLSEFSAEVSRMEDIRNGKAESAPLPNGE